MTRSRVTLHARFTFPLQCGNMHRYSPHLQHVSHLSYFAISQVIFWRKRTFREIFPFAKTSLLFSAEQLRCKRGTRGTCRTIWSSSQTKLCDLKTKLGKVGLENDTHCALRTNSNIYYSCTLPLEVYLSLWPNSKSVLSLWNYSSDKKSQGWS